MAEKINIVAGYLAGFAYESITISSAVKELTESTYKDSDGIAKKAIITVETAPIRWTYDGTTPTSSIGHKALPESAIILNSTGSIKNFQAIRQGSSDGKIFITYER